MKIGRINLLPKHKVLAAKANDTKTNSSNSEQGKAADRVTLTRKPLAKFKYSFKKAAIGVALLASLASSAQVTGGPTGLAISSQFTDPPKTEKPTQIDNSQERAMLKEDCGCGEVVSIAEGQPGKGASLTIHGFASSPESMKPVDAKAQAEGQSTSTYIYKDMQGCNHRRNSKELAKEITKWAEAHPGETLNIQTHSQGGRIALGALRNLAKDNAVPENPIKLTMISPPLAGFGLANITLVTPGIMARLIPGGGPIRDMSSLSGSSRQIRRMKLPSNVETSIYYGTKDKLVNYNKRAHQKVADNLNAEVYYIAGADHSGTPEAYTNPASSITSEAQPYQPKAGIVGAFTW